LTTGGAAFCWGDNTLAESGSGTTGPVTTSPAAVAGAQTFTTLSVGFYHACAMTVGGSSYCWGDNGAGQIGDGTLNLGLAPVKVAGQP
jgi:alpha-tubulin suppressor-like RCC1 family protein